MCNMWPKDLPLPFATRGLLGCLVEQTYHGWCSRPFTLNFSGQILLSIPPGNHFLNLSSLSHMLVSQCRVQPLLPRSNLKVFDMVIPFVTRVCWMWCVLSHYQWMKRLTNAHEIGCWNSGTVMIGTAMISISACKFWKGTFLSSFMRCLISFRKWAAMLVWSSMADCRWEVRKTSSSCGGMRNP